MCALTKLNFLYCKRRPHFDALLNVYQTDVWSVRYTRDHSLTKILLPVAGNTDYNVKNSCEFADFIRNKTVNACEELVSFEIVSLFTKIPIDLAVKVA